MSDQDDEFDLFSDAEPEVKEIEEKVPSSKSRRRLDQLLEAKRIRSELRENFGDDDAEKISSYYDDDLFTE